MKKVKIQKTSMFMAVLAVILIIGVLGARAFDYWGQAAKETGRQAYEDNKDVLKLENQIGDNIGAVTPTDGICNGNEPATTLCNVSINELEVQSTSTWSISKDGFIKRITLPTATSTGKGASLDTESFITNTWGKSVCSKVILYPKTLSDDLGMSLQVGTSTPGDSTTKVTSTPSLIALTLIATNTPQILDSVNEAGSAGIGQLEGWLWDAGVSVGVMATSTDYGRASSTPFSEITGFVDIECRSALDND